MDKTEKQLLEEVRADLKSMNHHMVDVKITLAKQHISLEHHISRTEASEKRIQRLEDFKWYFAGIAVIMSVTVELFRRFI